MSVAVRQGTHQRAGDTIRDRTGSRKQAGWLLVAYLAPVAVLVLSVRLSGTGIPQLADSVVALAGSSEILTGLRFGHVEALANLAVFVPIGFLLARLMGRYARPGTAPTAGLPDWAVWLLASAFSAMIELTQLFLLTERSATLRDLLFNSAGAAAGIAIHRVVQQLRRHTRRTP